MDWFSSDNELDEDDELLIEASQAYEDSLDHREDEHSIDFEDRFDHMDEDDFVLDKLMEDVETSDHVQQTSENRFANPVTEAADILSKIEGASTKKTTTWAVKIWDSWLVNRQRQGAEMPHYWLSRFVAEVRNKNGEHYHSGTLYSICAGLQRYIREKRMKDNCKVPADIYKDPLFFAYFRGVFDSVLKELHQQGIGIYKKQAEVISPEVEERLWNEGVLGDDTPKKLLDTLVFCFGLNFALRSGQEHRNLRPDMLEIKEPHDSLAYLVYTESGSKSNSGGLHHRKGVC